MWKRLSKFLILPPDIAMATDGEGIPSAFGKQ